MPTKKTKPAPSASRKTVAALRDEYEAAPLGARLAPAIAAAGLGLSPLTLERWRSVGKGPHYLKLGVVVRYTKRDVESFVQEVSQ